MKSLLLFLALFSFQTGLAQGIIDSSFGKINDTIVSFFNRENFEAIYLLGSGVFKQNESKEDFTRFLKHLKSETGNIISTPITECGDRVGFKWAGQKKNLRVEWKTSDHLSFDDYFINDIIEQPYKKDQLTDNKFQSRVDSLVDKYVSFYMLDSNAVGLSIGIIKDGKIYRYNYGEIKKGTRQLPASTSSYELGSIAKTFIATLLAQAAVDGKVNLQDDIRKYLPGTYPNLEYKGSPVRLVHLANHTSGLPGSFSAFPYDSIGKLSSDAQFAYFENYKKDSLFKDLHQITPETTPGTSYHYNSNAFHILIAILERLYHRSYEQVLTDYLSTHLAMRDTKNNLSSAEAKRVVQGYNDRGEPMPHYNNPQTMTGGPGLNSTLDDMLLYVSANLVEKNKALKVTHKTTWGDPKSFAVGLGWMMNTNCRGDRYMYHSGRSRGCHSLITFYPNRKSGMVILVNETVNQGRLFVLERLLMNEFR